MRYFHSRKSINYCRLILSLDFTIIIDKLLKNEVVENEFLSHLFTNYSDQVVGLVKYLNAFIREKRISDSELLLGLSTFSTLITFKQVVNVIVENLEFLPTLATPKTFELLSLFGPFFGIKFNLINRKFQCFS